MVDMNTDGTMFLRGAFPRLHVATAVPYTYRDGVTMLEKIEMLRHAIDETHAELDRVVGDINDAWQQQTDALEEYRAQLVRELGELREDLVRLIKESTQGDGMVESPVRGNLDSVQHVIDDLYDNVRVHAIFAEDYDDMELTAAEYDETAGSARNYDLHASRVIDDELGDYGGRDDYFTALPEPPDEQQDALHNYLTREEAANEYMTLNPTANQFQPRKEQQ